MAKTKETEEQKAEREMIEEIASNISALSRSVKNLLGGRLKEDSLIILLTHTTKLPQYNIKKVLDALKNMEKDHLK